MGIPIGLDLGRRDGAPVDLRRPRHLRRRREHRPAAAAGAAAVRPHRARLGAPGGPGHDRQPALRGGHGSALRRRAAADRHELLVSTRGAGVGAAAVPRRARPAIDRRGRALPRRPRPGSRHRAARSRRSRRCRATPTSCCSATARSQAELERRAPRIRATAAGSTSCRRCRPTELLDWVASADVVAMPIQPTTLNHRLTTPNKLFEAMAVGVPVVASDLPGMAAIVRETGCGVLCDPTDPAEHRGGDHDDPRRVRRGAGGLPRAGPGRGPRDVLLGSPGRGPPGRVRPADRAAVVTSPRRRAVVLVGGPAAPVLAGDPDRPGAGRRRLRGRDRRGRRAGSSGAGGGRARDDRGPPAPPNRPRTRSGRSRSAATRRAGRGHVLGASEGASGARVGASGTSRTRRTLRRLAGPFLDLRRWLLWPHSVRGWWATLRRDLAPADVYHACGALTIAAALDMRRRHPIGPSGGAAPVIYDVVDLAAESNAVHRDAAPNPTTDRRDGGRAGPTRRTRSSRSTTRSRRDSRSAHPGRAITVVPNIPEPADPALLDAPPDLVREAAGLPASTRIVLFHGRLGPDLGLEAAAEAILDVPDAALVLLGFGRGMAESRERDRDPRLAGRHVTLDARPPDEIVAWTASADVCLIPLPPVSANQRLTTPNKFWEAVSGGTPLVVVAGMTTLERLVREGDLGVVAASPAPADLAAAIREVARPARRPTARRGAGTSPRPRRRGGGWPAAATAYRALVRDLAAGRSSATRERDPATRPSGSRPRTGRRGAATRRRSVGRGPRGRPAPRRRGRGRRSRAARPAHRRGEDPERRRSPAPASAPHRHPDRCAGRSSRAGRSPAVPSGPAIPGRPRSESRSTTRRHDGSTSTSTMRPTLGRATSAGSAATTSVISASSASGSAARCAAALSRSSATTTSDGRPIVGRGRGRAGGADWNARPEPPSQPASAWRYSTSSRSATNAAPNRVSTAARRTAAIERPRGARASRRSRRPSASGSSGGTSAPSSSGCGAEDLGDARRSPPRRPACRSRAPRRPPRRTSRAGWVDEDARARQSRPRRRRGPAPTRTRRRRRSRAMSPARASRAPRRRRSCGRRAGGGSTAGARGRWRSPAAASRSPSSPCGSRRRAARRVGARRAARAGTARPGRRSAGRRSCRRAPGRPPAARPRASC